MFYLILIYVGIFLLVLSRGVFGDQARFFKDSYTVPGVVAGLVDKNLMASGTQRQPRVRFDTRNGTYEFDAPIRAQAHGLWPGNEVDVSLSPEFPNVAILKGHRHKPAPFLMIPGVALIGLGLFNGNDIVDQVTDNPMMSLGLVAAIVAVGMGFSRSLQDTLKLYYGLHDNIRPSSDDLALDDLALKGEEDDDIVEGGTAELADEPSQADRPEPVALETYGTEYRSLAYVLGILALPWLIGLFAPWPAKLFGILIPAAFLSLAAFIGLRQRRKYWDPVRKVVVTGKRWPGKAWQETEQLIKGFVRVEIASTSSSSSGGGKRGSPGIVIKVIHKDDDFMLASGSYSWNVAYYSSFDEKEAAENFASQVAYTLELPLLNKLY